MFRVQRSKFSREHRPRRRRGSQFSVESAVQDGREQGVQLGGGLGLQALHAVRKEVFGDGRLIVRPKTRNTPSP